MIDQPEHDVVTRPSRARLLQLQATLRLRREALRYVGYQQAERDCQLLAAKISREITRQELERCSFMAIPRGGMIVLGMLSYMLDLSPAQLAADPKSAKPLFVVDDCALSGTRFAATLAGIASPEVSFIHLYSHPELRRAISQRKTRVKRCVAARDLADQPGREKVAPGKVAAWRKTWRERLGPGRFWYGQPELVCFAWSEPDGVFWNSVTEQIETAWRFLPPHRCLKNRARLIGPVRSPPGTSWRVPEAVVSGEFDGVLWLCQTETDEVFSLGGVAADMWRLLAGWGRLDLAVEDLTAAYAVDQDTVSGDLLDFARQLRTKGLLESTDGEKPDFG